MKKSIIIISALCYMVFAAAWIVIGFAGLVFCMFDLNRIIPSVVKVFFAALALILMVSPIFIKIPHPKRSYISIFLVISFAVLSLGTYFCFKGYYSYFNSEKWHTNPNKRYLMIDSLEKNYNICEMNEEEIKNLLGAPSDVSHRTHDGLDYTCYTYLAGEALMDPYIYKVIFTNGIVTHTSIGQS